MTAKLPVGTLCWSLTAGFPLWPAVVMKESDVPPSVLQEPHTPQQTLVRFFGSVSYGWMDVCYPFRENYEANKNPEGSWDGFEQALAEATEYERTGQFIVISADAHDYDSSSSEEKPARRKRKTSKRKRSDTASDDDDAFGGSGSDSDVGRRPARKKHAGAAAAAPKKIKATRQQKLFARDVFAIMKQVEKALKEGQLEQALTHLKKFDPKATVEQIGEHGMKTYIPGPYAKIDAQIIHISRLGRFVHGLSKEHSQDIIGPYASMLHRHYIQTVVSELAIPPEFEHVLMPAPKKPTTTTTAMSNQDENNDNNADDNNNNNNHHTNEPSSNMETDTRTLIGFEKPSANGLSMETDS